MKEYIEQLQQQLKLIKENRERVTDMFIRNLYWETHGSHKSAVYMKAEQDDIYELEQIKRQLLEVL